LGNNNPSIAIASVIIITINLPNAMAVNVSAASYMA
jgi:hypothetical protein